MGNKQCINCKFYNSLGCPYTNPDREDDGDICDEFREAAEGSFTWKDTSEEGPSVIAPTPISDYEEGFTAGLAQGKWSEVKAAYRSGRKAAAEEVIEFLKEEGQKYQHGWRLGDAANMICDMFDLPELKLTDEELEENYCD